MASHANDLRHLFSAGNLQRCRGALKDAFSPLKSTADGAQRKAAILIPFCIYRDKPACIFVRRPLWMRKHAGEIAFPGGGVEATDKSIADTAIRECNEELGIKIPQSAVLGCLPISIPNKDSTFLVSSVMAYIGAVDKPNGHVSIDETSSHILRPHRGEIDDIYIVSIDRLISNERFVKFRIRSRGTGIRSWTSPTYPIKSNESPPMQIQIWGLTGFMLHEALKLLIPKAR